MDVAKLRLRPPDPLALRREWERLRAALRSFMGPGTFYGDLDAAGDGDVAALERLAAQLADRWAVKDPGAKVALRRLAEQRELSQATVKREAIASGVLLALGRRAEPQRMRFGNEYLRDGGGDRPAEIAPANLPIVEIHDVSYERWFVKEAINAAEAYLTDRPYPTPMGGASETAAAADPADAIPSHPDRMSVDLMLDALVAQEAAEEAAKRLAWVLEAASPQQRALANTMLDQLDAGESLNVSKAGRHIGMKSATARVQWGRFTEKVGTRRSGV